MCISNNWHACTVAPLDLSTTGINALGKFGVRQHTHSSRRSRIGGGPPESGVVFRWKGAAVAVSAVAAEKCKDGVRVQGRGLLIAKCAARASSGCIARPVG